MADEEAEDQVEEATEGEEGEDGEEKPKSKKKLLIIIILLLVITGGGAAAYFMLASPSGDGMETADGSAGETMAETGEDGEELPPVHYDLPEFLVNLNTTGKGTSYLKTSVTLELKNQDAVAKVDNKLPKIIDALNTYLRELRPSDLAGSAGIYRLREEIMLRINRAIYPAEVTDVYFKEMIVQ